MKRFLAWLMMLGVLLCAGLYLEQEYRLPSAILKGNMTESEKIKYIQELHDGLLNRKEQVVLQYRGTEAEMQQFVKDSVNQAFAMDEEDTSSDFDYMHYVHSMTHINMKGICNIYTVVYSFQYLETRQQTELVDQKVNKFIKKKIRRGMSDYTKIKVIHDYIIDHVEYDTSTRQNSPYYALVKGKSACQGYATLLYKMATEAGIPCRIITGTAMDGLHAWNIVKIDGKWYNIDATWDDPIGAFENKEVRYAYFLKSDQDLKDHKRDAAFETKKFRQAYPVSEKSYVGNGSH